MTLYFIMIFVNIFLVLALFKFGAGGEILSYDEILDEIRYNTNRANIILFAIINFLPVFNVIAGILLAVILFFMIIYHFREWLDAPMSEKPKHEQ